MAGVCANANIRDTKRERKKPHKNMIDVSSAGSAPLSLALRSQRKVSATFHSCAVCACGRACVRACMRVCLGAHSRAFCVHSHLRCVDLYKKGDERGNETEKWGRGVR